MVLAALWVAVPPALGKGGAPHPRPPLGSDEPIGAPIRDVATTLSVPLGDDRSVVLGLPERFWVQCPRYLPVPTCLDGVGLIAQYLNMRGGTVSMLYVGVVPFADALPDEKPDARAQRTASEFAAWMVEKYAKVEWTITSGPVTLAPVAWKLDGRKALAWRTKSYTSHPAAAYGGPRSVFTGECLLFQPPGLEKLVYVALDAKGGGTTLDKATEQVSVKPTRAVNLATRRVQLVDIAEALDTSRFPVRLLALDLPAGFVLTPAVAALKGSLVYVEERLNDQGRVDAVLRIDQHPADGAHTLQDEFVQQRSIWTEQERGPSEEVPLAVKSRTAWVFSHPSLKDGPGARAHDAVLRLDDQTLVLSWITFGDAAQAERDRAAFVALVRSIDMTTRW